MFNGEIISYNISRSPNIEQIYDMLDKAFARFDCLDGLILHSDQGWQYQHYGYRRRLEKHGIIQSMSRKGNCLDNAMAENFFGIMKTELLYAENFESAEAFMKALEEYIDYYNNKRIKSRFEKESGAIPNSFSNRIVNNLSNFLGSLHFCRGFHNSP